MRQLSFIVLIFALGTSALLAQSTPDQQATDKCHVGSLHSYTNSKCYIELSRDTPENPTTKYVPEGTTVEIVVRGARPQELITATAQTDVQATPDFATALLKAILDPLKSFLGSEQKKGPFLRVQTATPEELRLIDEQEDARKQLALTVTKINKAAVALSCLVSYKTFTVHPPVNNETYSCEEPSLTDFKGAKETTVGFIDDAAKSAIPIARVDAVKAAIADPIQKSCFAKPNTTDAEKSVRNFCLNGLDQLQSNQVRLADSITAVEAARKALLQGEDALQTLPPVKAIFVYPVTRLLNRKVTIKLKATEQITKTSVDLSTVTIVWQRSNWVLSTGMLVSTLASQSFSASPIYINGVAQTDSSGKYLTAVTLDSIKPSIVLPMVLGSRRFYAPAKWNGKGSFLITGGAGANLTAKSTDFAAGLSLQLKNILLSPVAHFGRQTQLINGVYIGEPLGVSPPTIPTASKWITQFGFAVTYSLPIP